MEMVFVPGGTFMMGSDPDADPNASDDELPQHEVTLDSFWIDRTEVTNAMYAQCVTDGDCEESAFADDADYNGASYPVIGVSWFDAENYCQWAGGRLPTEAEWEYAARGNDGRLYPWGNQVPTCELAQFNACSGNTVEVGSFSPAGDSWVEAADMAGNVWEWVADWYDSDYYENAPANNPTGPESSDRKVLRGGGWRYYSQILRVAYRGYYTPGSRLDSVGYRCVQPPG
jgi:formylglycine-generating enzyme required for sulfatase activity